MGLLNFVDKFNGFLSAKIRKILLLQTEIFRKFNTQATMTFKKILRKLNNRYIYATVIFLVLFLFVDQFNLFKQIKLDNMLKDQKQQINFYKQEISESKELLDKLQNDTATMERVAREQYMMKRDNEVIYLIETQE